MEGTNINTVESERILYTPSSFAKANLIHIQEVGKLKALEPHTSRRESLNSYLFFIVLEGKGIVTYHGVDYIVEKGDCVFLDCSKGYSHRSSEDLWTLKWVHFYGPNMSGIYEKYLQRGGSVYFHLINDLKYETLMDELYSTAVSDLYIRDMKLYEKIVSLLTFLMEDCYQQYKEKGFRSPGKRDLQPVKDYIDQNFKERIVLDLLADKFYINKFYLTRVFKEQFGISINSYILHMRITHAKQLLRFSDLSIEIIGQACGINDANYFNRMFKKIEGITPGDFRKVW